LASIQSIVSEERGNLRPAPQATTGQEEGNSIRQLSSDSYDDYHYGPYKVDVRGTMQIGMFADSEDSDWNENGPTNADINAYFDATEAFYLDAFDEFRWTEGDVIGFRMGYYQSQFFPASEETDMMAKFLISWRGEATVMGNSRLTSFGLDRAMDKANDDFTSPFQTRACERRLGGSSLSEGSGLNLIALPDLRRCAP
ncbi:MAG: hypothetical protein AAF497_03295, partial [Planctomycetota bacterium]